MPKKNIEKFEENETKMQVFSNKNVEKIEQKEKDIILKVKINNFNLDMQMDTGSEVTLILRNFWERIGKPILWKSKLLLRQFDGSVIKTFGYFEGSLELEDKFEVIPIIVTTCKKNHRLLGNNVLNMNFTKLINEIRMAKTGKLKNYKASLKLKENVIFSYYETQKLPVHLLPLVVAKLRKLIEQDLLEHVPLEGSKWALPIVVLRKSDRDYEIGVNHKFAWTHIL